MSRRLAVFVNPAAAGGRALKALPAVRAELDRLGEDYRVVETTGLDSARVEAGLAAEDGETVVAMGGDGLIGCLAGALRGSPAALGIVPGGRGNDFARVLGIPREPALAARLAARGEERLVDVGEVNGAPFVGIASVGFDSDVQVIANRARIVRGSLVYLYATIRALLAWRPAHFRVVIDGEARELTGFAVAAANSKAYGGGMYLAPEAELDDGLLDVVLTADVSKLRCLVNLPKLFKGTHVENPEVTVLRGRVVEIEADRSFMVYADGDPIHALPVTVTTAARALRVIAP